MAIPKFRNDGWLPEGHHDSTWEEIISVFGGTPGSKREQVMRSLLAWRDKAIRLGLTGVIILDGSFISAKENPGDFDAIYIYEDKVEELLKQNNEAMILIGYAACKAAGFDLFIFSAEAARKFPDWARLDAFDYDKITGREKGVLEVML